MGCIYMFGLIGISVVVGAYALYSYFVLDRNHRKLERWANTPKDELILHGYPRVKTIPSPSPFPLKVETYLRLNNIKYTLDTTDMYGPKGKSPWISINGNHIADSEFIIDFINKKYEKDLNGNVTELDLANARRTRITLEEYFMWGVALERMVYGGAVKLGKVAGNIMPKMLMVYFKRVISKRAFDQGIGRHSEQEVVQLMTKCLQSVSTSLGDRNYFGGDEICQEDCGIFSILAQCVWALPDSPYERLMNHECKNLKDYCIRIKDKAWPDWNELLVK